MADSALRLVLILQKIPRAPSKVSLGEIRKHIAELNISVSDRTLQRDLVQLSLYFPLISDERSRPFGWSFKREASIDMPAMNPHEAITHIMANKFLSDYLPKTVNDYLSPQLLSARETLRTFSASNLGDWSKKVIHVAEGFQLTKAETKTEITEIVYDALLHEKRLLINYKGKVEQEVSPLGLILKDRHIYLVCTFWEYERPLQIALSRIDKIAITEKSVKLLPNFNLQIFVEQGHSSLKKSHQQLEVVLKFTKPASKHFFETPISSNQEIEEVDEKFNKVSVTVDDTKEFRWWLLGFGAQVEVLAPEELREEFTCIAMKMNHIYQKG